MNNRQNIAKVKAIELQNRKRLLAVNPKLDDESGIYFLTREDENGFRYAYIGQAVHIMQRLCSHLVGYQHIDLSLKSHNFYSADNPYGWKVNFIYYPKSQLDEQEQYWIKQYADKGYQLRNKTSGSQGEGKTKIGDYKPHKGYYDGLKQGENNLKKKLRNIIQKHLIISIKPEKMGNKISEKQFEKFQKLIWEDSENERV